MAADGAQPFSSAGSQTTRGQRSLAVAQVTSETGFSGGEVQLFLMIEGLRSLGHRCVVFCAPGSRAAQEAVRHGVEWVAVRMRNGLDWPAVLSLARGYRRQRVDLVHLHTGRANWLGGMAAWATGIPAITTRRMDRRVKRGWRTRLIYERFTRCAVAISPAVRACLLDGGVPSERIHLIPEGVDPERLRPGVERAATRAALAARDDNLVVLALAALVRRKGIDVLLDALSLLRNDGLRPLLWVAGDGPERAALETQSSRLGLTPQVRFLGERNEVADLLAACDVFVLPSRREGLGVAALEAMAAGRAVVCSAVGGLRDSVVDQITGLLVAPDNPRALASALARVLEDRDLRGRLAAAGPARVAEGFHASQMVAAHDRLYRQVVPE